jgi:predicted PurR-regulated permease PerM
MVNKITVLISAVILIVIAVVLYPLIGTSVAELTDNTSANYVGDDTAPIVSLIPIFYNFEGHPFEMENG